MQSRTRCSDTFRRIGHISTALLVVFSLWCCRAGFATAQQTDTPIELQETNIFGMGARAMGMGKAYTAVSEDVSALLWNPAGLAQIRRVELSVSVAHDAVETTTDHTARRIFDDTATRLDHLALAYPIPTYRGSLVLGFAFRRQADLEAAFFKEGFLLDAASSPGLFELENFERSGAVNAWTAGVGWDLSPRVSVGASVSYLTGSTNETVRLGNFRIPTGGQFDPENPDVGDPGNPDDRLFDLETAREADLDGYTGSLGILFHPSRGVRLGAGLDLPAQLNYDGFSQTRLEDWEKIDEFESFFEDNITMPVSLRVGASWGRRGLLVAGGLRWTDYRQIDFEGDILAPPRESSFEREFAYRNVIAIKLGAEYQLPTVPLRFRAGFFTEPIPYNLMVADTDFLFVPDDNNTETEDDISVVGRDFPDVDILSDRKFVTAGVGVVVQRALSLDVAFLHGWWERTTPAGYENGTGFYPTLATTEKVSQNRVFVSTTLHFE